MEGARAILPDRIEGDGLLLRRWRVSDAEVLGRAVEESYDHLRPWMSWMEQEPLTHDQRREMLAKLEREWSQGGDIVLGVFLGDEVAGGCGMHRQSVSCVELGYWIRPSFTRQGLATAVARMLTDAAFSVSEISRVEIHADKANSASFGVPRRLGFGFLGETPREATAPSGVACSWRVERDQWLQAPRDPYPGQTPG